MNGFWDLLSPLPEDEEMGYRLAYFSLAKGRLALAALVFPDPRPINRPMILKKEISEIVDWTLSGSLPVECSR